MTAASRDRGIPLLSIMQATFGATWCLMLWLALPPLLA
jgi:hypothetical protein